MVSDVNVRDDFAKSIKEELAKRVGFRCSNPQCRQQTSGPTIKNSGTLNIGVAAHITAAAPNGPRYNEILAANDRKSSTNGIWLCQKCAKLVDSDIDAYPPDLLHDWKETAEATALLELKGLRVIPDVRAQIKRVSTKLPDLFDEMRKDIKKHPFTREFVLLKRRWQYNGDPDNTILAYYFDDHPELRQKIRMLENCGLVHDITFNNVTRFKISEELAEYLEHA